jgi:hypothetical protein
MRRFVSKIPALALPCFQDSGKATKKVYGSKVVEEKA